MRIAVTGGTGYVGAHSTRALLAAGHTVRLLISQTPADEAAAHMLAELGDVEILRGDVRDAGVWTPCSLVVTRCCTVRGWSAPTPAATS